MSDLISRQAAIDCEYQVKIINDIEYVMLSEVQMKMRKLPSAEPKRGKWMKEDRGHVEYCAVCDQCGFDWIWSDREYFKFCPNCGADMRGEL